MIDRDSERKVKEKICDRGTEEYLRSAGVSSETIKGNQEEYASNVMRQKKIYYDESDEKKGEFTVNVADIKGVSRAIGFTWFDLLNFGVRGLPHDVKEIEGKKVFNIREDGLLRNLSPIEKEDLNRAKQEIEDLPGISFNCFRNGKEKEYYQITNGNHRVIAAKNLAVPCLKANSIILWKYNPRKYMEFTSYQRRKKRLIELAEDLTFFVDCLSESLRGIHFDYKDYSAVFSFSYIESKLEHDFSLIDVMNEEVNGMVERLERIKKGARMKYTFYKKAPEKVRNMAMKFYGRHVEEDKGLEHLIALKWLDKAESQ